MRESTIEKYLKTKVEAHGGLVRKLQWIGRNNAPDRFVSFPENWWNLYQPYSINRGPLLVELKAPGEKPTAAQLREHNRLRDCTVRVVVIDSIEGVDALVSGRLGGFN